MEIDQHNAGDMAKLLRRLSDPFDPRDVKWKPQAVKNNRALAMAYLDARAVMDRLDDVLGVAAWQDEYQVLPGDSVVCTLLVLVAGGWIAKSDVGSPSEQPDSGDRMKAAFSDALKRAAVKFGVGRYLYRLKAEWVDYDPARKQFAHTPQLPAWAVPNDPRIQLASAYLRDVGTCPDEGAMADLMARIQRDKEAGKLDPADLDSIRAAIRVWQHQRNKQQPAKK